MIRIAHHTILYRIASGTGKALLAAIEYILSKYSDDTVIIPAHTLPWTLNLAKNTDALTHELKMILEKREAIPFFEDLSEEQRRIVTPQKWKTFFLYAYGHKIPNNTAACPATTKLVESIPGMTTAFFSILEPYTHIAPHRGLYKGVLRYHLGLLIPENPSPCYLKIDGKKYSWRKGESLVFDDTVEHEAHNDTGEMRVVLFVDFKRNFPFPVNFINDAILFLLKHSPFVTTGIRKINEKAFN